MSLLNKAHLRISEAAWSLRVAHDSVIIQHVQSYFLALMTHHNIWNKWSDISIEPVSLVIFHHVQFFQVSSEDALSESTDDFWPDWIILSCCALRILSKCHFWIFECLLQGLTSERVGPNLPQLFGLRELEVGVSVA